MMKMNTLTITIINIVEKKMQPITTVATNKLPLETTSTGTILLLDLRQVPALNWKWIRLRIPGQTAHLPG